jgi:hypothetical protein
MLWEFSLSMPIQPCCLTTSLHLLLNEALCIWYISSNSFLFCELVMTYKLLTFPFHVVFYKTVPRIIHHSTDNMITDFEWATIFRPLQNDITKLKTNQWQVYRKHIIFISIVFSRKLKFETYTFISSFKTLSFKGEKKDMSLCYEN